ncbi:MAG: glycosyltransferase, partial [Clostridiales bacterium]|nr:glycosyltransferase [Clostridiales bacterium]
MKPLISVCCILNETDIIAKAFADYLEQEFSGSQFEVIIVDNGLSESARNDLSARKFIVLDGSGDR